MLFGTIITKDLLANEDRLVENLYIFLNNFVNKKLIYENDQVKQDCVQDTIMALLKKVRLLTDKQLEKINLEKYLYNRANSYISSIFLGKLKRHRERFVSVDSYKTFDTKITSEDILSTMYEDKDIKTQRYIRENLLDEILGSFTLDKEMLASLDILVRLKLETIGIASCPDEELEVDLTLEPLAIAAVDEYLLRMITNE